MVDNTDIPLDPYIVLGLNRYASSDDIRKAYKILALKHHPDKSGGDDKAFKKINEAYQILNDNEKRKIYDSCYDDNVNLDLLSKFASVLMNIVHQKLHDKMTNVRKKSSNPQKSEPTPKKQIKEKPVIVRMTIDLDDMYNSSVKKLVVKVRRRQENDEMSFVRVPLYISLLNFEKQYEFEDLGDDDEDTTSEAKKRGDIIVKIDVDNSSKTVPTATKDTLFSDYDIHIEQPMTLYEYLYGLDVKIPYFNGEEIHVTKPSYKVKDKGSCEYYCYVHEVLGKGLPYVPKEKSDEELEVQRGNLYIFFKLYIDVLPEDVMSQHENIFKTYFNGKH